MQLPIPRLPDSLILAKFEKIAAVLSQKEWRVDAGGERSQLFSVSFKKGESTAWQKNGVAEVVSKSTGITAKSLSLMIDGRHVVQIHRLDNSPQDQLHLDQNWFGGDDENARLAYSRASGLVGAEFIAGRVTATASLPLTPELAHFVESRDQGLARLEELYARFARQFFEDRERLAAELREKETMLDQRVQDKSRELEAKAAAERDELRQREAELDTRLKEVDNREAKFVRRDIRNQLKQEIKNRQSKFELTAGTRRMRQPIIVAVALLAATLGYGFYYYTVEIVREMTLPQPPESYVLAIMLARQLIVGLGLGGTIWFFIHWQNLWSQRHAEEEFAVKRLELDLDRASWVVELAMEWSKEKHGQELPGPILKELTKNLFNDRDVQGAPPARQDAVSALLDASTKAEIAIGDMKFSLDRKAAKKLKEALEKE